MDINAEIEKLLREIGPGRMSSTAYDTSWVARLGEIDRELSTNALSWLCEHQLPDGSWGAAEPFYYHDRVISTLAAMIALTYQGRRAQDKVQIEKGLLALEKMTTGATIGLAADPNGATVGFEMIVPTLVAEAEKIGIIKQQGDRILGKLGKLRQIKMAKLHGLKINRNITPAFSAEMAGDDGRNLLDIDNIQEKDGSVAHSPSATAYFAQKLRPNDPRAMEYLRKWASLDGGLPNFAPIDIFEIAWSLWNLRLIKTFNTHSPDVRQKANLLRNAWEPRHGIGTASECTIKDSDDSSMVFETLLSYGYAADIESVLQYEEPTHFRCFSFEANPSISANIHVLGALHKAGLPKSNSSVKKVLAFLKQSAKDSAFWYDKWHSSPYYATSHMIIASVPYDKDLCANAVKWILKKQRSNGSWGFYRLPTTEETAYCIQALKVWHNNGGDLPGGSLELAYHWLKNHIDEPCPPLWIGKALYIPHLVVKSTLLSALALAEGR
jgi:halimadienyl-diphosphate synthase